MQLSAIVLARALAFVETFDLAPQGRVFFPDVARELVQRYGFLKFPKELNDFDEQKGVEFVEGKLKDTVIEKLVIYNNGILLDTRANTETSRALIEETLLWAKSKFGLVYEPGMIKRVAYVSNVTFYSDVPLNALNPALQKLADRVSGAVSELQKENIEYQTSSLSIAHDPLKRKYPLAVFSIQPRTETPFSEHKFFSEAPLPTDLHIKFLEEFEADVISSLSQVRSRVTIPESAPRTMGIESPRPLKKL